MGPALGRTFDLLTTAPNEAAVNVLLWALDSPRRQIRRAALRALITRPSPAGHREILESVKDALSGKLVIDTTVPLVPPKVSKVQMPVAGSAAQEAQVAGGLNGCAVGVSGSREKASPPPR